MHTEHLIPGEVILDVNRQYLQNNQALLIKNLNDHGKDGSGALAPVPVPASELYDPELILPDGDNLKVGEYVCDRTNETYILIQNDQHKDCLYRITNGKTQVVFVGDMGLIRDPVYFVGEGRFYVDVLCLGESFKTFAMWTDGNNDHRFLCVEDSIATNFFNPDKFPYFKGNYFRNILINLGVPTPVECMGISPVSTTDKGINHMKRHFWRWRLQIYDIYGRPSEHGIISDPYYIGDCHSGNINCVDLTFEAGTPLWNKIILEFNNDGTQTWHQHKVFDKYIANGGDWWTRKINEKDFTYDKAKNTFTYRFCATGECVAVPEVQTARVENPLPVTSESLFPLAGGIGLANNKYGRGPLPSDVLDQIDFSIELPAPDDPNATRTRNITIWVPIFNGFGDPNPLPIWTDSDNNSVFGSPLTDVGIGGLFGQVLPNQGTGFIGYLAGTRYAAISTQYQAIIENNQITGWKKYGLAENTNVAKSNKWIQKFEFKNIKPGTYVFRIAGHGSQLSDGNYQRTSTFVKGICKSNAPGSPAPHRDHTNDKEEREIKINVCAGDYDSIEAGEFLFIEDLTFPGLPGYAVSGYVYEDNDIITGAGVIPMEYVPVKFSTASVPAARVHTTDHNGFYYISSPSKNYIANVAPVRQCVEQQIGDAIHVGFHGMTAHDFFAVSTWPQFAKELCNRIQIKGRVVDCGTKAPIPNVVVLLSHSQPVSTAIDGTFELIAHDLEGGRQDTIIFMSEGSCQIQSCDGAICLPTLEYNQPNCINCTDRIVSFDDYSVKITGIELRGPQLGGRYGCAVSGGDWMDRQQFAQIKNSWYLNIPTANEMKSFTHPKIKWTIKPGAVFPLWMTKLHLRISKNLAYQDMHSWVVDRFELIDNTGLENKIAPTQIRVHYSSLNEYNKQNNFSTNATWQVIDEAQKLETQDIVQFVANGDGKLFDTVITGQIKFDKNGEYFQIDYDPQLAGLIEGALIKFMRPGTCQSEEIFFELCKTISIQKGVPTETSGYLNAFDSYYVSRQIPTPVVTSKKIQQPVAGSSNPITYTTVEVTETNNVIKPYSWLFEHHSPSDFWGDHAANQGRPMVKNPLESIICKEDEIALSGVLGVNGLVNFLHYFDEARKKLFNLGTGGIVSVIIVNQYVVLVCRTDWAVLPFDDNSVIIGSDSRIQLKTADQQFGRPISKQGENFGCHPADRNTISYTGSGVVWFDRNRVSLVGTTHEANGYAVNLHHGKSLSEGRYYSYLKRKVKGMNAENNTRYFVGKYNFKDKNYYFTDFDLSAADYVNTDVVIRYDKNETIAINATTGALKKFCSFTPEGYASLRGDDKDEQFFIFKKGVPWSLHKLDPIVFNNFFGTDVPWAWQAVVSIEPGTVKKYISLEILCKQVGCYVPKVITESGQLSRIPRNWFNRGERYWVGPFLCDTNTVFDRNLPKETGDHAIYDGDKLTGRWLDFLMVADPSNQTKYFELTEVGVNLDGVISKKAEGK